MAATAESCADHGVSEHKEGRAWDWMLDAHDAKDRAVADSVLGWLLAPGPHGEPGWNARRFGLMYVIWNGRIWGAYRPEDGWRTYVGESDHTDHIHFSFSWAGAEKRTSWWTGHVAAIDYGPCQVAAGVPAAPYRTANPHPCAIDTTLVTPYAQRGDSGPHVRAVQAVLFVKPVTGFFGPKTFAAVKAFQQRARLPQNGVVDAMTAFRMRLGPNPKPMPDFAKQGQTSGHVRLVQVRLRVRPLSGYFGPKTLAAVKAFQKRSRLPQTGVVDPTTAFHLGLGPDPNPPVPPAPPPPAPPYARPGDTSTHVIAVQRKLGVYPATGHYGPKTFAAVKAFQKRHRLPQTGVVDHMTAVRMGLLRS